MIGFGLLAGSVCAAVKVLGTAKALDLTPEERSWLLAHPTIKIGMDPQWPPFSFTSRKGEIEGIDVAFFREIETRLGVHFEIEKARVWDDVNQAINRGDLAVVSGISPTPERAEFLTFTKPYISYPTAIITRMDGPFMTDLSSLKNQRLASPRNYVTTDRLKKDYPDLALTETSTELDALQLVAENKADVTVENLATVSYLIRENGLTNLKVAGVGNQQFELHFGVQKDSPLLHSALEKALASISSERRAEILSNWIYVDNNYSTKLAQYMRWAVIATVAGLIGLLGFWLWNRYLKRQLLAREKIEAELRRLNEEKSRFINMAAHDINNPLTIILMSCEMALARPQAAQRDNIDSYQNIMKHGMRISHLIQNLLNADSIEQGLNRMRPEDLNFADMTQKVVNSYQEIAGRKAIALHFEPPTKLPMIRADYGAVTQVIENLISNAVKFSPKGSIVKIAMKVLSGKVCLEIQDSGPGISTKDLPALFGKYARLSAEPTGSESSHGLGLYIVKQLIDEMKGRVWAESRPIGGATFSVELPLLGSH
jgi:two-component system, NarL family, sensor histidine kinase EvgS